LDRSRARAAGLSAFSLASFATIAAAAGDRPRLAAERWLAPEARLEALSSQPRECLSKAGDLVAIGRTAFRTPALLGGQAAKAGMSCASCHTNGRANPGFAFPGLSGAPGTADVTSSLMSSHRGNGAFDPQPIPDLALPGKVSRDAASPALGAFVHGLITQEFDGAEPGPAARDGMLAYLRAMRPCEGAAREPVTAAAAIGDVEAAVSAAASALRLGDRATARLMLAGARATLGEIDERFALPGGERVREGLRAADRELLALQLETDAGAAGLAERLGRWRLRPALVRSLDRLVPRSLYDPARLAALLASD
jgi:hypothetical protein